MTDGPAQQPHAQKVDRQTRWAPVLLMLTVLVVYYVATRPGPPLEGWGTDFEAAMAEAAATNRKILIAFHTDDCPPCVVMERTVLNTARVQDALEGFILLMLDPFRQREPAGRLRVHATPTYVVLDGSGRLLARAEGYQSAQQFVKFLKPRR